MVCVLEARFPPSESARIEALRRCQILDTEPQPAFGALVRLAAQICGTPIALISLVDTSRLWFKARVGVKAAEVPRDRTGCSYTIQQPDILVVPDMPADERFRDGPPAASDAPIRFYAGVPLITPDGHAIGTLCVQDYTPRAISPDQAAALQALGRQVMDQIALRQRIADLEQTVAERERFEADLAYERDLLHTLMDSIPDYIYFKDATGRFTRSNRAHTELLGFQDAGQVIGKTTLDLFESQSAHEAYADDLRIIQTGQPVSDAIHYSEIRDSDLRWYSTTKAPIKDKDGQVIGLIGISRNITRRMNAEEQIRQLNARLEAVNRELNTRLEATIGKLEAELALRGRLTEELRQQHEYLAALHDTGLGLMNRLELNDLLEAIIVRAAGLLGTPDGFIGIPDETDDQLIRCIGIGAVSSQSTTSHVMRGVGVAGRVWATGQPLVVNQYDTWEGRMEQIPAGIYHSVVGVPLTSGQQVVGVLSLTHTEPGRIFSADQVTLLVRFAHLASIALDNAQLYTAAQRELAERRKVEATLRESETRLRLVMRQMPAALWTTDRDLQVTSSTGALTESLRGMPKTRPERSLWDYFQTDDRTFPPIASHFRALMGESDTFETTWQGYTVQGHVEPFLDSEGQIIGCIAVGLDITEGKRAAEQVKRLDDQRKRLFEISQSILATLEFDQVVQQILHTLKDLLNHEICALFWPDGEEGVLRPLVLSEHEGMTKEVAHVWSMPSGPGLIKLVIETGKGMIANNIQDDPRSIIRKDLTLKRVFPDPTIHTMIVPVGTEERTLGVLAVLRFDNPPFTQDEFDLVQLFFNQTALALENARLFQQVKQSEAALAQAVRHKDEFLATMSHELRTPLNAILGMSEALQEQIYGPLNPRQRKTIAIVEESGRHLLDLINDILDLSKIGAGKLELEIAPLAVEPLAKASLRLIEEAAHKKQITIITDFDRAVGDILADNRRLKQILVNLLNNAVKFTPEGGTIGLEVAGDTANQVVRFTVWDTGIGIAPEDQGRLFKPFEQLDSSLARQYAGTGLGLALVSSMVGLHGGSVKVESEVGYGSTFIVELPWRVAPRSPADGAVADARPSAAPKPAPERTANAPLILLAEDNELNILTLSDYLESKGYRVALARNGREAIMQARETRPALILMDSQMPEMDGLEAIRRIRADADLAAIQIIALTAMAMPEDRERCLTAGANAYLSKPVSLQNLVAAIETHLGRE
jgi:PAS domain S-box-containing protein